MVGSYLYITEDGVRCWYDNRDNYENESSLHRINGPATINMYSNGYHAWYFHGEFHRLDGPARYWIEGRHKGIKEWYYQGNYIDCHTQKEFEKIIKLRVLW
jgi:hypothetical protein